MTSSYRALGLMLMLVVASDASATQTCQVLFKPMTEGAYVMLTDVERSFPKFQDKAEKGVAVTLAHLLRIKTKLDEIKLAFGCSVTFDLWTKQYTIVPSGSSLVRSVSTTRSIKVLPEACKTAILSSLGKIEFDGAEVELDSSLDPISEEQSKKTRSWLAERGISSASQALLGRAVAALIDLKEDQSVTRRCQIKLAP